MKRKKQIEAKLKFFDVLIDSYPESEKLKPEIKKEVFALKCKQDTLRWVLGWGVEI